MWYAVETVLIDNELFGSQCVFLDGDTGPVGHCYADHSEEPMNSCKRFFNDRIEIHTDWFESEELAKQFCRGEITYIHYYKDYDFLKREIVKVDEKSGIYPYRGIGKIHPVN